MPAAAGYAIAPLGFPKSRLTLIEGLTGIETLGVAVHPMNNAMKNTVAANIRRYLPRVNINLIVFNLKRLSF